MVGIPRAKLTLVAGTRPAKLATGLPAAGSVGAEQDVYRRSHVLRRSVRFASGVLRRHWLFAIFVFVATGLRIAVSLAYWPALELMWDSYGYLADVHNLAPGGYHPLGYGLFLALLSVTGRLGTVVIAQHMMGIAMGALLYVLALRLGARRWLAALAALPVLLDGYQLDIEQFILAETLTEALLVGGLAVLLWHEQVGARRGAMVGLLLAAAVLTRTAILPVLVVVGIYLIVRGRQWRPLLAYAAVALTLLLGYGGWYATAHGSFGYSDDTGHYLYGRVAPFATCHYKLTAQEARICPSQPVARRSQNTDLYDWWPASPLNAPGLGTWDQRGALGKRFAITVIEHQPVDYAKAVLADTWHYFAPGRWMTNDPISVQRWVFPPPNLDPNADAYHVTFANASFNGSITAAVHPGLMGPLRSYQRVGYTPGPVFLACLIAALLGALGLARRPRGRRQERWAALVLAVSALVVLLSPSVTEGFSYRYGLPVLMLLPPAGLLAADVGLDALTRRWRRRSEARSPRRGGAVSQGETWSPRAEAEPGSVGASPVAEA